MKSLITKFIPALAAVALSTISGLVSAQSTNADLSNLAPGVGTLAPAFDSATTDYTASVPYSTNSLTVTPTAADAGATITVNGNPVASGSPSDPVSLNVGDNVVTTVVTAEDTVTTKTYTLTVNRAAPDVNLSNLVPSVGTLAPAFDSATTNYTASVSSTTTSMTVTPTAVNALATITVNGNAVVSGNPSGSISLSVGPNVITTVVTGEDAVTTKTYTITVTRAASNVNLSNLVPSSGTLRPTFASGTITYTAGVPYATTSLTVTPTAADVGSTIAVNGNPVTSGSPSGSISLNVGNNVITTVVTGDDNVTTRTYTLTVKRAVNPYTPNIYEPFADSNASLTGNTPGTGLSGTWTASSTFTVASPSQAYGFLSTSGNKVNYVSPFGNAASSVPVGFDLRDAGLLADGTTLWFSVVVNTPSTAGSNPDTGFAIGTDVLGSGNGIPMPAGGQGIGWSIQGGLLKATSWNNAATRVNGPSVAVSTTKLIVGEITWGAGATDGIKLYLPDTSLNKGAAVATLTGANLSQLTAQTNGFDTITSSLKTNTGYTFDEIRFGATYEAVVPLAYWDLNGNTAGTGSATPSGIWDATSPNWNAVADGTGTVAPDVWSPARTKTAVFSAGTDATGIYTVTVSGTQDIGGLVFEEGAVTLTGGTALRMTANTQVSVATGVTSLIQTPISEDSTARSLTKSGTGTLILGGSNSYSGATSVNAGTLSLGANNVLPDTAVSIGTATLDAATFSEGLGTLDPTTTSAKLNLGTGGTVAFADSSVVDWTGGKLTITGSFVSGSSIRFGTSGSALTATQLGLVVIPAGGPVALNSSGYLIEATPPTLASANIVDDKSGGPVNTNTVVTYTLTFSEDIDSATVTAADFGNQGSSTITIGAITETSPGVFTVQVTPTTAGTLELKVIAGAVISDTSGNNLNTSSAIVDDTSITVNSSGSPYDTWSGGAAFEIDTNGDGVKNGLAWLVGAADKNVNALGLLPAAAESTGNLVLTFDCLSTANRGTAALNLQYSKDLGVSDAWASHEAAVPGAVGGSVVNGVTFTATANGALIHVVAEIPASAASPGTTLFGRLNAVNPP